jgi:hypothetical protein
VARCQMPRSVDVDALPVFIITCVVARLTFFLKPAHDMLLVVVELVTGLESGVEFGGALGSSLASVDDAEEEVEAVEGVAQAVVEGPGSVCPTGQGVQPL